MDEERMKILEMVSAGTITAGQAAQLITALEASARSPQLPDRSHSSDESDSSDRSSRSDRSNQAGEPNPFDRFPNPPLGFKKWNAFWLIPLSIGVAITVFSGMLLSTGIRQNWNGFWMFCIWTPLFFGILVILIGWASRTARWLHVRVNTGQDEWPRHVAVSLPLPLRTSAWVMRTFGHYIPGLDDVPIPIHEAILALQESLTPDDPLYVKVDDSDGERVEVYIG
jgi:hypothetical protein